VLKKKNEVNLTPYYVTLHETLKQNEVLRSMVGTYKNRHFYLQREGKELPIYFKKKKYQPHNGDNLKIHYAHLGYYKQLQLVIYSKKDFEILEK